MECSIGNSTENKAQQDGGEGRAQSRVGKGRIRSGISRVSKNKNSKSNLKGEWLLGPSCKDLGEAGRRSGKEANAEWRMQ